MATAISCLMERHGRYGTSKRTSSQAAEKAKATIKLCWRNGGVSPLKRLHATSQSQFHGRQKTGFARAVLTVKQNDVGVERRVDVAANAMKIGDVEGLQQDFAHRRLAFILRRTRRR
jgi:hypothetical protein